MDILSCTLIFSPVPALSPAVPWSPLTTHECTHWRMNSEKRPTEEEKLEVGFRFRQGNMGFQIPKACSSLEGRGMHSRWVNPLGPTDLSPLGKGSSPKSRIEGRGPRFPDPRILLSKLLFYSNSVICMSEISIYLLKRNRFSNQYLF